MSDIEKKLSALSPDKRALLEAMLRRQQTAAVRPASSFSSPRETKAIASPVSRSLPADSGMDFSFMFFSDNGGSDGLHKYDLLLESAKFADAKGFRAIWIPERHFHSFGGLFPNPSVIAAALAMVTRRLELRAGSIVLPLHNPIRAAEEWAIVDNLSGGRVSLSFATGWHENDFVLAPAQYHNRKEISFKAIEEIKRFWSGEARPIRGVRNNEIMITTFPRPINNDLSIWVTSAGSIDTFQRAGEIGAHILTGLTGQSTEELAGKIARYRQARTQNGHNPAAGRVALMLHSFIGDDLGRVKEVVRQPMYDYLRTNLELHKQLARSRNHEVARQKFGSEDEDVLLQFAFERYFNGSSLFGTVDSCADKITALRAIGVTEIACLLDFGLDNHTILEGLPYLEALKNRFQPEHESAVAATV